MEAGARAGEPFTDGGNQMFQELNQRLSEEERRVVRAVFDIPPERVDARRSGCEESSGFIRFKVLSADESRCPFEFHFGRGEALGRFNFFFGSSAELYNYESLQDRQADLEIALDVERFLKSTVVCERRLTKDGEVASEMYAPDLFVVDGVQTRFGLIPACID